MWLWWPAGLVAAPAKGVRPPLCWAAGRRAPPRESVPATARGVDAGAAAVSLIMGFPRRLTTTSSPAATRSIHCPKESRQASALTVTGAGGESEEWS